MIRYRKELWQLLQDFPSPQVAEIGVAEGFFSADMLRWPIRPRVYMVDRWACMPDVKGDSSQPQEWHDANLQAAIDRTMPFECQAVLMRGESTEMAKLIEDGTLALVYIDGDHSYEGVWRDIHAWHSKVVLGGYMAFHDYEAQEYGVKRAVTKFCSMRGYTIYLLPENSVQDAGAYFQVC